MLTRPDSPWLSQASRFLSSKTLKEAEAGTTYPENIDDLDSTMGSLTIDTHSSWSFGRVTGMPSSPDSRSRKERSNFKPDADSESPNFRRAIQQKRNSATNKDCTDGHISSYRVRDSGFYRTGQVFRPHKDDALAKDLHNVQSSLEPTFVILATTPAGIVILKVYGASQGFVTALYEISEPEFIYHPKNPCQNTHQGWRVIKFCEQEKVCRSEGLIGFVDFSRHEQLGIYLDWCVADCGIMAEHAMHDCWFAATVLLNAAEDLWRQDMGTPCGPTETIGTMIAREAIAASDSRTSKPSGQRWQCLTAQVALRLPARLIASISVVPNDSPTKQDLKFVALQIIRPARAIEQVV